MAVPKKKRSQKLSKKSKTNFLKIKLQKFFKKPLPFLKAFFFNKKKAN